MLSASLRLLGVRQQYHELWRDNRQRFDIYQSTQEVRNAPKLNGLYWVSFVGTPYDETLFVGVYRISIFYICQVGKIDAGEYDEDKRLRKKNR